MLTHSSCYNLPTLSVYSVPLWSETTVAFIIGSHLTQRSWSSLDYGKHDQVLVKMAPNLRKKPVP